MDHARLPTEVQLKNEIIDVLQENRPDVYMSGPQIGRKLGTYRQPYNPRANDPLSRKHYDILRKLKNEGRVEHSERIGWRLTKAEWNRLPLDE